MEVALLGPVRASHDGMPVLLGGSANRALIAILALAAPHALTVGELVDALWVHEPDSVNAVLQTRVSRLRRAFKSAGSADEVIITVGRGYRFAGPPRCVDLHRVRELDARAQAARQRGDLNAATSMWRDAMAQWSGEPLSELGDAPFVTAESARLRDLRLSIAQARFDTALQCGRHDEVVAELRDVVATAPLHEGLWRALMLALFRCGRRSDALAAYAQVRVLLRDELGLDPSSETSALHAAILAADPQLQAPPTALVPHAITVAQPRLALRPPRPSRTRFIGRQRDVVEVGKLLRATGCVTITGPGGVGKTRLAMEVAIRGGDGFADGIVVAELAAVSDGALVTDAVASAVGLPRPEHDDRTEIERLLSYLSDRSLLLVLDNCEHVIESAANLTATLLRALPSLSVLATSREALRVDGEAIWRLTPLAVPDAATPAELESLADVAGVRLFLDRLHLCQPDLVLGPDDAVPIASIVRDLDGLPLALEIAAAAVDRMELPALAAALGDRFSALSDPRRGGDARQQTLWSTIEWSYELLDEEQQSLFEHLGVLAGPADLATVREVSGSAVPDTELEGALRTLLDRSLLSRDGSGAGRYAMLDTVRAFARAKLHVRAPDGSGYAGLLAWAQRKAVAGQALEESGDIALDDQLVEAMPNIRAALRAALDYGHSDIAGRIATCLRPYWQLRGGDPEGDAWYGEILASGSDDEPDPDRARIRADVICAAADLARTPERARELMGRGIALARRIGDRRLLGRTMSALGDELTWRGGDLVQAEQQLMAARPVLHDVGDRLGEAVVLERMAALRLKQNRLAEALPLLRAAADTMPDSGYPTVRFWILIGLGFHLAYGEQLADARVEFERALAIAETIRFTAGELYAVSSIGQVDIALGNVSAARGAVMRAAAVVKRTGVHAWDGWTRALDSRVLLAEGDFAGAARALDDPLVRGGSEQRPNYARRVAVLAAITGLMQDASDLLEHADRCDTAELYIGDSRLRRDVAWVRTLPDLPAPATLPDDLTDHAVSVLRRVQRQNMIVAVPPA